jgi:glycerol-3-phosphate O-acyltransferase
MALPGLQREPLEEEIGSSNENKVSRSSSSPWPEIESGAIVFLLDARDDFEAGLLRDWVESRKPGGDAHPPHSFVRLPKGGTGNVLATLSGRNGDVWMQPLRHGRITEPGRIRRRAIAKYSPDRLAYVAGSGAYLQELRDRQTDTTVDEDSLPEFVVNQALIALERAERVVRGARYKVPRILKSDVFANADFQNLIENAAQQGDRSIENAAQQGDRSVHAVTEQAARYLREMAATQTPFTLDMMNAIYRAACQSHHDAKISVDDEQLARVAETMADRPVVFLISHKSMLDTMALSLVLFDANLPLPLTFGGINLNKPGLGAFARRSGIIFLRRSFQDNEIYKATFRRYIDYLIEKRFSLLWALEGTRSRTGKLLPPRFGLFSYVVESILRTRLHDVTFIPVSVAYDQITEVEDYSIEQRGQKKKPEGFTWPLRFLRRGRSRGQIHLRFGEGVTVKELVKPSELEAGIDDQRKRILVPTLAFEVAVRMNAATPITATAIITLILLAGGNRAQSLAEIRALARAGAALIRRRHLEIVGRSNFRDEDAVRSTLDALHETGIVTYLDEGTERLYAISADQHLNAAYYRNTAIHYFILDAFVEIALLDAASASGDPIEAFFERTSELRELFKFEFYLPRRADYRSEIEQRTRDRYGDWEDAIQCGKAGGRDVLNAAQLLVAHAVLRSFVDAYRIVACVLVDAGADSIDNESRFLSQCLKTGKHQLLQGRVFSAESISKSLYETGLKLADYRGLLAANQEEARDDFHQEFCGISSRLDEILSITLASDGIGQNTGYRHT